MKTIITILLISICVSLISSCNVNNSEKWFDSPLLGGDTLLKYEESGGFETDFGNTPFGSGIQQYPFDRYYGTVSGKTIDPHVISEKIKVGMSFEEAHTALQNVQCGVWIGSGKDEDTALFQYKLDEDCVLWIIHDLNTGKVTRYNIVQNGKILYPVGENEGIIYQRSPNY